MPSLQRIKDSPCKNVDKMRNNNDADYDDRFSQLPDNKSTDKKTDDKFSITSARKSTNGSSNGSSAMDIVAVVLNGPTQQEKQQPPNSSKTPNKNNSQRISILIGDYSLPQCARVSINVSSSCDTSLVSLLGLDGMGRRTYTANDNDNNQHQDDAENIQHHKVGARRLGQLQQGDIIRLNHFEVKKDYQNESTSCMFEQTKKRKLSNNHDYSGDNDEYNKSSSDTLLSVACDLSTSFRDPAIGPSLVRLCRINPNTSFGSDDMKKEETCKPYDLEWESIIPPNMETSNEVVMKLASWYCTNMQPHLAKVRNISKSAGIARSCALSNSIFLLLSKSTAILPANQPCQRRKVRDITSSNLLSHVVVKVLRCEKAMSSFITPRKAARNDAVVTHATLSDGAGSEDLLGLCGSLNHGRVSGAVSSIPKSISSILLQSMNTGSQIVLTHVLSQSSLNSSAMDNESLVLIPTRETTATILTPSHPYFVHDEPTRDVENQFVSQPLTLERASQLYSMTQQYSPPVMQKDASVPSSSSHCRGVMAVIAPLMDVIVDGIDTSFMEGLHFQSPEKLSKFLMSSPSISTGIIPAIELSPSYRSATLILDPKSVANDIHVHGDGNAMKLLCMDVPVKDMLVNVSVTDTPNPYLGHVGNLLKILCTEKAPIRWVLEQESERSWFVTNAHLLEI